MSDSDLFFIMVIIVGSLIAAYKAGAGLAQEEMIHRLLGMKRINNRWVVPDGTEIMGMKWVGRCWVYDDGKQQRRVNYNDRNSCWEFEDGTRPDRVMPGLKDISGHWESSDGKTIDHTQMKPLDFADALHDWANKVGKFVPLGIEDVKLGLHLGKSQSIMQKYGKLLEKPGPLLRKESDLPVQKTLVRIELAKALLDPDLNAQMKNGLSVGFAQLELFLGQTELKAVGTARRLIGDPEIADRLRHTRQTGELSSEEKALAQAIVDDRGDDAVWQRVLKKYDERVYQAAVLTEIASGSADPDMAKLIAKIDAEANAASLALKQWQS